MKRTTRTNVVTVTQGHVYGTVTDAVIPPSSLAVYDSLVACLLQKSTFHHPTLLFVYMLALVHPYTPGSDVCSPSQTLSSSRQTRTPLPARKSSSHTSTVDRERVERVTVPSTALSPSNGRRSSSRTAPENHPSSSATTATNIGSSSSAPSPRIGPARTPPPVDVPSKPVDQPPQTEKSAAGSFDIHAYPATDLLRLLASLLTQIAATNDALSTSTSPTPTPAPRSPNSHAPTWAGMFGASRAALATPSAPLAFHARNIPTISLEAYLLRILKYCPATNEVFLALLVYFDRMSRLSAEATGRSFVIDSYNIHRLVIAGVTVASKFFSDVFYTNSRYAKVSTYETVVVIYTETDMIPRSAVYLKQSSTSSSYNSCC